MSATTEKISTSSVFTDYVRSLQGGGEPDAANYAELREALRAALVHQLKVRGLWQAPPSYLGVYGGSSWEDDALLDELVADVYAYIFIRRLPGLLRQQMLRPNIDGLVFLGLKNFLHDTQRKHDPIGYQIFKVLESALERALDGGRLVLLENGPPIRNETAFAFTARQRPTLCSPEDLARWVKEWNHELLPDLLKARGKAAKRLVARLAELITGLAGEVEGFRFRDLIDLMKHDARERCSALLSEGATSIEEGEELLSFVPPSLPGGKLEEQQSFRALNACVEAKIDREKVSRKKRDQLRKLLAFLRESIRSGEEASLSNLGIAKLLGFPKDSVRGLKEKLASLIDGCKHEISGKAPVRGREGQFTPRTSARQKGASAMHVTALSERQRLETLKVSARFAQALAAVESQADRPPRPGDTFLLPQTWGLEWLVVATSPGGGEPRHLVVPMDDNPLLGSNDVEAVDELGRPLSLRCGFGEWLDGEALDHRQRTGALGPEVVRAVEEKREEIAAGTVEGTVLEQEVDDDPAYRAWICEVLEPGRAGLAQGSAVESLPQTPGKVLKWASPSRWTAASSPLGVAASVLLLVGLGLSGGLLRQQTKISTLKRDLQAAGLAREQLERDLERVDREHRNLAKQAQERGREIITLEGEGEQSRLRIAALERRLAEVQRPEPQINLPFKHFTAHELVRGGGASRDGDRLRVPAAAKRIALILEVAEPEPYPRYRLAVLTADGRRTIWRSDQLELTESELSVDLPTALFSSGSYLLRVHGLREDEADPLVKYRLALELEQDP